MSRKDGVRRGVVGRGSTDSTTGGPVRANASVGARASVVPATGWVRAPPSRSGARRSGTARGPGSASRAPAGAGRWPAQPPSSAAAFLMFAAKALTSL
ncbi:hypothetical protein GCM10010211_57410 [Streptomyces albospinus]|uniref:Uncharacterized protein n=1 Tax=Streptomyces albospinus TaxID=285515 RepID=A0ABQ2VGZ7_9ACTN|nr:hypothetical protein GCM10010211_57410 [Streptomyces albospinus]